MWRLLLSALVLAGCVQLPPSPQDIQAKKFESLPDKAVIYIVRSKVDSVFGGTLWLGDRAQITTYAGTYYRWEVTPGSHRIAAYAPSNASVTLQTSAGRVYFVQHTVFGDLRAGPLVSFLEQIHERDGRVLVAQAQLL